MNSISKLVIILFSVILISISYQLFPQNKNNDNMKTKRQHLDQDAFGVAKQYLIVWME